MSKSNTITVKNVRVSRDTVVDVTFSKAPTKLEIFKCRTEGRTTIWVTIAYSENGRRIGYSAGTDKGVCVVAKTPAKAFAKAVKKFWS